MSLDRIGYLLKHAYLAYESLAILKYEALGATARECGVLVQIRALEGASQLELAAELGIDRTTMAQLLDTLERRGLISRTPLPADRRRNAVAITPAGRDLLDREEAVRAGVENEFLAPIDAGEREAFRAALHALRDRGDSMPHS